MYSFLLLQLFGYVLYCQSSVQNKNCANCKFAIKQNPLFLNDMSFSKCALFSVYRDSSFSKKEKRDEILYYYCSTARTHETMCGQEGKYFEERETLFNGIGFFGKKKEENLE